MSSAPLQNATFATPGLPALLPPRRQPHQRHSAFHRDTSPFRYGQAACQAAAFGHLGTDVRRMVVNAFFAEVEKGTPRCAPVSMVGSGQFGTPWRRMHTANLRPEVSICCTTACGQSPANTHCWACCCNDPPVLGSRHWQALWPAWSWEVLAPSSCALTLGALCELGSCSCRAGELGEQEGVGGERGGGPG